MDHADDRGVEKTILEEKMMFRKKSTFLFLIVLGAVLLSGCSFVRIQNVTGTTATVVVTVPDSGKPYTRTIQSGAIVDVFSSHGGRYTITTIPSEQWTQTLNNLEQLITDRLFNERATLTAEQVRILTENLNDILSLQEQLSDPGVSCSGYLADFDTSVAIIAFDSLNSVFELSCGSSSGGDS